MKKTALILPVLILLFLPSIISNFSHFNFNYTPVSDTLNLNADSLWSDSVLKSLTLDEKIAQLMMIRVLSNRTEPYYDTISQYIKKYNIGGLCFFQGGPVKQAQLTNRWQGESKTPILVSIDGEWGLNMRLDSTMAFPRQMTLGAVQNNKLIYDMGAEIARQCKRIGIHMNFAPVLDINSNPKNPVINTRSFGESKYQVTTKALAYMKGLQENGIIAVGKHFPGHGDTDTDSHFTLPLINHSKQRLDTLELYPFRELINKGLMAIMTAHLSIPAYFPDLAMPSTLSPNVVDSLLKKELSFDGLAITDALDMKGASNYFKPGTIEIMAFKAGNDILLLPPDINMAIEEIKKAVLNGEINEADINSRCRKVLLFKYRAGLHNFTPVKTDSIYEDLNTPYAILLKRELIREAITLLKNNNNVIPWKQQAKENTACLAIGDGTIKDFQKKIQEAYNVELLTLPKDFSKKEENSMWGKLEKSDRIIISIHNTNSLPQKNFGITTQTVHLIKKISKTKKIILCLFATPYALSYFENNDNIEAVFVGYQDDLFAQEAVCDIIAGKADAKGLLPVTGSPDFPLSSGIMTGAYRYLSYEEPAKMGINTNLLAKIDSVAISGIINKAYPGCQILLAKDGKVFFHKSYGYHTYDSTRLVLNSDLYDVASLTKILCTNLCLMKLYDEGKLTLTEKLSDFLPYLKGTDKENIRIFDVLGHQAGFKSWIPFYASTIINGKPDSTVYCKKFSKTFPVKVADSLYINKSYYDTIIKKIVESPLNKNKDYLYSDLGLYFLKEIIEKITDCKIDDYANRTFYSPIGLNNTVYNPLDFFPKDKIAPTEIDSGFRNQTLQGYVNDQGAAMLGGVACHAGIFSNAWDVAVIMQMLLNEGKLDNVSYIKPTTVNLFTKRHFVSNNNRRALLFDKPLLNPDGTGPTCISASPSSFGHSGFTGTYTWADPDNKLIYVFLSNRTYPKPDNKTISTLNIRTLIHQLAYEAVKNSK